MNRLILIGNGFDLAHGLKTSYCDFIRWFLAEAINIFYEKGFYEDELILLKQHSLHSFINPPYLPTTFENSIQDFKQLKSDSRYNAEYKFFILTKSNLLEVTIDKSEKINWVDIEVEYFEELSQCQEEGIFNDDAVELLNKQFTFLKEKLEEYISLEQIELKDFRPDQEILKIMKSEFEWRDFDTGFEKGESKNFWLQLSRDQKKLHYPALTQFVNFNYTNTVNSYIKDLKKYEFHKKSEIIHIHGELNSINNPVIFGFGDEFNSKYTQFEEQKNNSVFEHIKSYWYFKSSNYRNLVRFLNGDMFQVFIMGHSCGLSDRTMFREIFEHENCKSVKIFYYEKPDGSNDFYEKTVNLGRHFSDKGRMRKLIVEFNEANKFPQCN